MTPHTQGDQSIQGLAVVSDNHHLHTIIPRRPTQKGPDITAALSEAAWGLFTP